MLNADIRPVRQSPWYETQPVPDDGQPWFVNGAVAIETALDPEALLARLHRIEGDMGRIRGLRNAARIIDLDLIAYDDRIAGGGEAEQRAGRLVLPHPLMHLRRFVLQPMADVAPDWRHPRLGLTVREMLAALPPGPVVRRASAADPG